MWVPHFGATAWHSALIGASLKCEDCTSFGNDLINGELKHQTWYLTKNKKNSDMVPQKKKKSELVTPIQPGWLGHCGTPFGLAPCGKAGHPPPM